ncbi:hypothetical protein DCCM_0393 [Desulfocucumis palustris]|uniref:Uncharacterized protein n=1 Tax=Desulfocucumis palustris TaxID=1898651 RepID=A0A2L2X876_9FIRM|nr:hypothetical protein DCCM_0393 [Desulfocucumis palustris]
MKNAFTEQARKVKRGVIKGDLHLSGDPVHEGIGGKALYFGDCSQIFDGLGPVGFRAAGTIKDGKEPVISGRAGISFLSEWVNLFSANNVVVSDKISGQLDGGGRFEICDGFIYREIPVFQKVYPAETQSFLQGNPGIPEVCVQRESLSPKKVYTAGCQRFLISKPGMPGILVRQQISWLEKVYNALGQVADPVKKASADGAVQGFHTTLIKQHLFDTDLQQFLIAPAHSLPAEVGRRLITNQKTSGIEIERRLIANQKTPGIEIERQLITNQKIPGIEIERQLITSQKTPGAEIGRQLIANQKIPGVELQRQLITKQKIAGAEFQRFVVCGPGERPAVYKPQAMSAGIPKELSGDGDIYSQYGFCVYRLYPVSGISDLVICRYVPLASPEIYDLETGALLVPSCDEKAGVSAAAYSYYDTDKSVLPQAEEVVFEGIDKVDAPPAAEVVHRADDKAFRLTGVDITGTFAEEDGYFDCAVPAGKDQVRCPVAMSSRPDVTADGETSGRFRLNVILDGVEHTVRKAAAERNIFDGHLAGLEHTLPPVLEGTGGEAKYSAGEVVADSGEQKAEAFELYKDGSAVDLEVSEPCQNAGVVDVFERAEKDGTDTGVIQIAGSGNIPPRDDLALNELINISTIKTEHQGLPGCVQDAAGIDRVFETDNSQSGVIADCLSKVSPEADKYIPGGMEKSQGVISPAWEPAGRSGGEAVQDAGLVTTNSEGSVFDNLSAADPMLAKRNTAINETIDLVLSRADRTDITDGENQALNSGVVESACGSNVESSVTASQVSKNTGAAENGYALAGQGRDYEATVDVPAPSERRGLANGFEITAMPLDSGTRPDMADGVNNSGAESVKLNRVLDGLPENIAGPAEKNTSVNGLQGCQADFADRNTVISGLVDEGINEANWDEVIDGAGRSGLETGNTGACMDGIIKKELDPADRESRCSGVLEADYALAAQEREFYGTTEIPGLAEHNREIDGIADGAWDKADKGGNLRGVIESKFVLAEQGGEFSSLLPGKFDPASQGRNLIGLIESRFGLSGLTERIGYRESETDLARLTERRGYREGATDLAQLTERQGYREGATDLAQLTERQGYREGETDLARLTERQGYREGETDLAWLTESQGYREGATDLARLTERQGYREGETDLARLTERQGYREGATDLAQLTERQGYREGATDLAQLTERQGYREGETDLAQLTERQGYREGATDLAQLTERQGYREGATDLAQLTERQGYREGETDLAQLTERQGYREGATDLAQLTERQGYREGATDLAQLIERQGYREGATDPAQLTERQGYREAPGDIAELGWHEGNSGKGYDHAIASDDQGLLDSNFDTATGNVIEALPLTEQDTGKVETVIEATAENAAKASFFVQVAERLADLLRFSKKHKKTRLWKQHVNGASTDEGGPPVEEPEKKKIWLIMGKPGSWNIWPWKKTR